MSTVDMFEETSQREVKHQYWDCLQKAADLHLRRSAAAPLQLARGLQLLPRRGVSDCRNFEHARLHQS